MTTKGAGQKRTTGAAQGPRPSKPAKPRRRRRPDKPVQLSFHFRRKRGRRGGWRPGAGRPRQNNGRTPHTRRPALAARFPVHVTLSVDDALPNLRSPELRATIDGALREARERFGDFRVVHYSIQRHHLHLIVEAQHARALSRGMQGLCIRLARAINRVLERRGAVFVERYFERILRTPRQVRNCLLYVLNNVRRHAAQGRKALARDWTDPCSSAAYFDGWKRRLLPPPGRDPPVRSPRTWLLAAGWRRHGLIGFEEVPGGATSRARSRRC
jgi:REP element-mobilizing transposase RayT